MAYRLRNLKLQEVSVVDSPANQKAHIVLFKRDDETVRTLTTHPVKIVMTGGKIVTAKFDDSWTPEDRGTWTATVARHTPIKSGKAPEKTETVSISLGALTAKAMMSMSLDDIRCAVCDGLRTKFGTPDSEGYYVHGPWINELYLDNVIYEMMDDSEEEHTYRASYAFDASGNVTFGDPVEVQEVYVPVPKVDTVSAAAKAELEKRVTLLDLSMRTSNIRVGQKLDIAI